MKTFLLFFALTIGVLMLPRHTTEAVGCQYPSDILDLTNWKETLPIGTQGSPTEIKQPALKTFVDQQYFHPTATCDGVVFRAPISGVTTGGSAHPRSELREMTNNGSALASWSATSGIHTMIIDEAITALPIKTPNIVAGQIHDTAGGNDITVIRLEGTTLYSTNGNNSHAATIDTNYSLGQRFQVKFVVQSGSIQIYYKKQGAASFTLVNTVSSTIQDLWFKAGAYTQSNCTKEGLSSPCADTTNTNYGEVIVYQVAVDHTGSLVNLPTPQAQVTQAPGVTETPGSSPTPNATSKPGSSLGGLAPPLDKSSGVISEWYFYIFLIAVLLYFFMR